MKYQLPELKILLNISQILKENYQGYNYQRLSFIRLFNRLVKLSQQLEGELRTNILFSACLLEQSCKNCSRLLLSN